jgi:hypothetical protein
MGGDITVRSIVNKGSTFTAKLPLPEVHVEKPAALEEQPDNPVNCNLKGNYLILQAPNTHPERVKSLLSGTQCHEITVYAVGKAKKALHCFGQENVELHAVIIDADVAPFDCDALASILENEHAFRHVPVIKMTNMTTLSSNQPKLTKIDYHVNDDNLLPTLRNIQSGA